MQQFELVLKNERAQQYQLLTKLAVAINLLVLLILAVKAGSGSMRVQIIAAVGVMMLVVLAQYYLQKSSLPQLMGTALAFILITYLLLQFWWAAGLVLLLFFMYSITRRKLIVAVNKEQIIYPSFPRRHIAWTDLNNLILKDGLLTIDFRNNRVAQNHVINSGNDNSLNETEFNEFCRRQLNQSKSR
jgi:hypothetical protein